MQGKKKKKRHLTKHSFKITGLRKLGIKDNLLMKNLWVNS